MEDAEVVLLDWGVLRNVWDDLHLRAVATG